MTDGKKKREKNLRPFNTMTVEEQRKIQSMGGKKSVAVRKEKKLMSEILSDYLQKEHEIVIRDAEGKEVNREKIPATELIERTITTVMARGDSASASIIKTLGELTEGNKLKIGGLNGDAIPFEYVDPPKPDESPE